jgi:pimeloyl-ACP methyl ester carboxylesterase
VRDPQSDPDAFYTPPAIATRNPGELIRSEGLVAGVPNGARAWRILYTTTNADGSPAVSSGIVVASARVPAGPRPVIAVAHGTTGIAPKCAPSLSDEPFGGGARAALEQMVAKGWVGVISDYVGLGTRGPHAYLVGESEARNVLDAVRAAHKLRELELDMRTVVWGHSQGGHGALWTGIVAPEYASEFNIIGVAAMAPATDLRGLADGIKGSTIGKVVLSYIADSWSKVYPELGLASLVTPESELTASRIGQLCFVGREALAAIAMSARLADPILRDSTFNGRVGELLRANTPTRAIAAPVFIAQGDADRLVLPTIQKRFVADRCAAGQALEYRVYAGKDHVPLVASDSPLTPELVAWTEARLAGQLPTNSC